MTKFKLTTDPMAANGTSLSGHIETSYKKLVEVFGEPEDCDEYKVSGVWTFQDDKGNAFTIYDWKSTNLYDPGLPSVKEFRNQPSAIFNIGSAVDAGEFLKFVSEKTEAKRYTKELYGFWK